MNDLIVLAHGPLGPFDDVAPLGVSIAVFLAWWVRAWIAETQLVARLRRVSLRIRERSSR